MLDRMRAINIFAVKQDVALLLGVVAFVGIAVVDWKTTYELSLNPFYLILVGFVTWNCGWVWGLVFSILSIGKPDTHRSRVGSTFLEADLFLRGQCQQAIFRCRGRHPYGAAQTSP